ncbi:MULTISPECIES: type II toxin-antitoxin system Phd/YefM family antitoxin [unclassified Rickettsia]|uniref:type II toxin-antitoxin system Phd/YefM family antitoxin n=1 Tax=unclassified Rickettsia TaxID=114295 RepID=UPI003132DEF7
MKHVQYRYFMKSISSSSFRKNLSTVFDTVERDHIPYLVKRRNHTNLIIITEEEYESTKETLYLLSNPANAEWLQESIEQAKRKEFVEVNLDD